MLEQTYGGERRNEVGRGLAYAAIGFSFAGPIGAAIGGFIGASQGSREDRIRKANKPSSDVARPINYKPNA